ncbi:hypothetical protein C5B42_00365 [Candidatus Cerribacteria bacterium 'Amazon FNV 2010 28 9']|uniref:EamA domain-containing protein n=1 Tax=Candidatus Cerribacteria bacterium 'Amazon FNV 2010 28 9' TaxID=2081795 RepID=A0A317JQG0_9BACT|nr:MAG: hypothetical protein C5B42_00365 [Candidatus Cerribacteria bacterium 'Amazon FNV 2010 28 9']
MSWLIFSIISILFTVTYGLISKSILSKNENFDPIPYAFVLFTSVSIYSFILYFLHPIQVFNIQALANPQFLQYFIPVCLLYAAAPSLYYRVLKHLPISEVTILYALTGIYALFFGLAIHSELFSLFRIFGALFIFVSVLLVSLHGKKARFNRYFWMMVVATLLYAIAAMIDNKIVESHFIDTTLYQALNFGIPAFILLLLNPRNAKDVSKIIKNKTTLIHTYVNGLFFFFSFFFIFKAYEAGGYASQVNLVLSTETIVTVIFAAFFLKERKYLNVKIIAALFATLGVYLLSR